MVRIFSWFIAVTALAAGAVRAQDAPPIADNSFLLEEAYNQEKGVIQHISAFQRSWGSSGFAYSFVQEWPAGGQRHQLSYTIPILRAGGTTGVGDVLLNWRVQAAGTEGPVSVSPRLSLVLPTGSRARGFGSGALGAQFNLPVSATLAPKLVTHWNAGATIIPSARNGIGSRATTTGFNLGASGIVLVHSTMNIMVELAWTRAEAVAGPGATSAFETLYLNPGVRWAHNFKNGLQIVPGVAFPIGMGPSSGDNGLFLYVSFEHPM